jgi:peptidoglycan/xylan/chitin deacetylase (PgdA/CDA1 family)
MLCCDGRESLEANLPTTLPSYRDERLDPYRYLDSTRLGDDEDEDPFHFAPSVVQLIAKTPGQEVGSHTFSHYYCLDDGDDAAAFRADLQAARFAAAGLGVDVRSFVFPRNQCNPKYLSTLADEGFRVFRGTPPSAAHRPSSSGHRPVARATRLADTYLPLLPFPRSQPRLQGGLIDVSASRFLRPYSHNRRRLEPLRRRRIVREMRAAARSGSIYHLWWHPHNFGLQTEHNLTFLRNILCEFAALRRRLGMVSRAMGDFVEAPQTSAG